ncbi:MAG: hypothetical protein ACXV8X_10900 [Candidatus Angelobacter sp.]
MKSSRIVLLVAMVLYVASFFLSAVIDAPGSASASPIPGYACAYLTLLFPWTRDALRSGQDHPLQYIAMLLGGWINPMFLITMGFLLKKRGARVGEILRIVLLFMFPACWVVFSGVHMRPTYGYFLWTSAMLVALFSGWFASKEDRVASRKLPFDKVA